MSKKVKEVKSEEVKEKRVRRSFEEIKAEKLANLDDKIANAEKNLELLKAKREEIANKQPKHRRKSDMTQASEIVKGLIAGGKSLDDIKQMLGVE